MAKRVFILSILTAASCMLGCHETSNKAPENPFPDSQDKLEKCAVHPAVCPEGTTCNGTVCLLNAEVGEACSEVVSLCKGGECVEGKCQASEDGNALIPCGEAKCTSAQRCDNNVCVAAVAVNEACYDKNVCALGLRCNFNNNTCMVPVNPNADCSMENSYCIIGVCSAEKICEPKTEDDKLKIADTDGDTISDFYDRCDKFSNPADSGTADCHSMDSDGDTIPDKVEALNAGIIYEEPYATIPTDYNFMSKDSDMNGISDSDEACPKFIQDKAQKCGYDSATGFFMQPYDTDGDTIPDYASMDNDGDRVDDSTEIAGLSALGTPMRGCDEHCANCNTANNRCTLGTLDNPWDTDGDTIPDYLSMDSDSDTIPDFVEFSLDSDGDTIADRYSQDSDGDTIPDKDEIDKTPDNQYVFQVNGRGADILINGLNLVKDGSGQYYTYDPSNQNVSKVSSDQVPEHTFSRPAKNAEGAYCFQSTDCDLDGLLDKDEVYCDNIGWSGSSVDIDGDGHEDVAEYSIAQYAMNNNVELKNGKTTKSGSTHITDPKDLICNPDLNVKDIFDYYFNLPVGGPQKSDTLMFEPEVSKLDLVFNVDTTNSMQVAIDNVKTNIDDIIEKVNKMVTDSAFALTNFDDFPVNPYGNATAGDLPFRVIGKMSSDKDTVKGYVNDPLFTKRDGFDGPESGTEALYQIATGEGTSWNGGSIGAEPQSDDSWGAVGFRSGTLPIVIHITDVYSHDRDSEYNNISKNFTEHPADYENKIPYKTSSVPNPHYTEDIIPLFEQKGIRVITVSVPDLNNQYTANDYKQMLTWSRYSNAIVPQCAFKRSDNSSPCGDYCCLGLDKDPPVTINGRKNSCILKYRGTQNTVAQYIADGVDALVKYGTYEVATVARTDPNKPDVDTSCFIKRVEAVQYYPPEKEPAKSCNPVAEKSKVEIGGIAPTDYDNGFSNFAPGTSQVGEVGAKLEFKVVAQNLKPDGSGPCVEATNEAQIFSAFIDVINPTTGLVFGTREVSIVVPAAQEQNDN